MPDESSSGPKAAKSQHAAQRRSTKNAIFKYRSTLASCALSALRLSQNSNLQRSSRSCLLRAPAGQKQPSHNMPRSAARKQMRFSIIEVNREAVRLVLFDFPRILFLNGSCLLRAPAVQKRQVHNMPRSAARQKMRFSIIEVSRQAVRLVLIDFPRILFLNSCWGHAF